MEEINLKLYFTTIKYLVRQKCLVELSYSKDNSNGTILGQFKYKRIAGGYRLVFQSGKKKFELTELKFKSNIYKFDMTTKMEAQFINFPKEDLKNINSLISKNQKKYFNKLYPTSTCQAIKIFNFYYFQCNVSLSYNDYEIMICNLSNLRKNNLNELKKTNESKIEEYKNTIHQLQMNILKLENENKMIKTFLNIK